MFGLEFGLGVACTLGAEFLLAHFFLWRAQKAASTALTIGNAAIKAATPLVQKAAQNAPGEIQRMEDFFKRWYASNSTPVPTVVNTPLTGTTVNCANCGMATAVNSSPPTPAG